MITIGNMPWAKNWIIIKAKNIYVNDYTSLSIKITYIDSVIAGF